MFYDHLTNCKINWHTQNDFIDYIKLNSDFKKDNNLSHEIEISDTKDI